MSLRGLNRALLITAVFSAIGQNVVAQSPNTNRIDQRSPSVSNSRASSTAQEGVDAGPTTESLNSRPINPTSPAQTNASRTARPVSQPVSRPPQGSRFSSLSDVPYMIGDTTGGGGAAIQLGGFPTANAGSNGNPGGVEKAGKPSLLIQHPSFGNSRLNIAENNSPVVSDRVYMNYRHFHNASEIDIFSYSPLGGLKSLDINTWTLGIERKLTDNSSVDIRLPILSQLASNLNITQTTGPVTSFPLNDTNVTVGNLGLIFKMALIQSDELYMSAGTALNLPTAPNVSVRTNINDDQFQNYNPSNGLPLGSPFPFRLSMNTRYMNDTVNLTPFLGTIIRPSPSIYGMSFLQLDVPLNSSRVDANGTSFVNNQLASAFNLQGRVDQQVLLRTNLAAGKWLWQNDRDRLVNSMGLQGEMHYTTSLNDADVIGPIPAVPNLGVGSALGFGNTANRIDLLDTVIGVQSVLQRTLITNSFIVPIRSGSDRIYDFEYSLSVIRRF